MKFSFPDIQVFEFPKVIVAEKEAPQKFAGLPWI
jgi:hypothetical protein